MKIVVIGGSGLIGTKLVPILREHGHEVVAAPRRARASTPSPAKDWPRRSPARRWSSTSRTRRRGKTKAVLEFFETSSRNILAAEKAAGVAHHVALSVVGTERLLESGYFRAKLAQENLIKASGVPYTIVRATQFFEFVGAIVESATDGDTSACRPRCSSRSPPTTSPPRSPTLPSHRRSMARSRSPVPSRSARQARPPVPLGERRSPKGDRRRPRPLLRHADRRPLADARRKPAPWPDPFRGLAEPVIPSRTIPVGPVTARPTAIAFLSEVDIGSHEENASERELEISVLIQSEPNL